MSHCERLATLVANLDGLITREWESRGATHPKTVFERDRRFVDLAHRAVEECSSQSLRVLLDEIPHLSHYFGSYVVSRRPLDHLLEQIYDQAAERMLEARARERSDENAR